MSRLTPEREAVVRSWAADVGHTFGDELLAEIDALRADLASNAAMLARQCDLAREAETHASRATRERDEAERALSILARQDAEKIVDLQKDLAAAKEQAAKWARREFLESIAGEHPAEAINEELRERNMTVRDLACRIVVELSDVKEIQLQQLSLEFYLICGPTEPNMILSEQTDKDLSRVFRVSDGFFMRMHNAWREKAMTAPPEQPQSGDTPTPAEPTRGER